MTIDKLCSSPIYPFLSPWNKIGIVRHEYSTQGYWHMNHKNKDSNTTVSIIAI